MAHGWVFDAVEGAAHLIDCVDAGQHDALGAGVEDAGDVAVTRVRHAHNWRDATQAGHTDEVGHERQVVHAVLKIEEDAIKADIGQNMHICR